MKKPRKMTEERKELIKQLYEDGVRVSEVANLSGVSNNTVFVFIRKLVAEGKIKPRNPERFGKSRAPNGQGKKYVKKGRKRKLTEKQEKQLLVDYYVNNMTIKEVEKKYGIWHMTFMIITRKALERGEYQPKRKRKNI